MNFDVVADGLWFPEGPIALPDGSVLFVELPRGALSRAWGDGRTEVVAMVGDGPNGAAIGPDGAVYICNNGGLDVSRDEAGTLVVNPLPPASYQGGHIDRVDLATGRVERLYDRCGGHRLSAPNDIVFDTQGGMWFTDFGRPTGRTRPLSAIYYASADGRSITEAYLGGVSFNGIGLSADETTLYVSDTYQGKLWSFGIKAPGVITDATASHGPARFVANMPGAMQLDSLALTESGAVCIGTIGPGGIAVVSPDGAVALQPFPDDYVTNICFGGADLRTAYITMVSSGRLIRTRWPEPGQPLNFVNR